MVSKGYNFQLLLLLSLFFVVSCFRYDVSKFPTNSECFLTDLSVIIGQSVDSLDIDFSIFKNYVDEPTEGYSRFTRIDSVFNSKIIVLYSWGYNIQSVSISRRLINIEENLDDIKYIWLSCSIPIDTIDTQLADIAESVKSDSISSNEFYSVISLGLKETYSWRYTINKSNSDHKSIYIDYEATGYRK